MDFIERLFGLSPDGGTGSLELLVMLVAGLAAARLWRTHARRRQHLTIPVAAAPRQRPEV